MAWSSSFKIFSCLSLVKQKSIPLVPYNSEQNKILVYQPFVLLLHKLGLHLPVDANKLFVRIPEFWTADMMFNVAEKLGPIKKSKSHLICEDVHFLTRNLFRQSQVQHFIVQEAWRCPNACRWRHNGTAPRFRKWFGIFRRSDVEIFQSFNQVNWDDEMSWTLLDVFETNLRISDKFLPTTIF